MGWLLCAQAQAEPLSYAADPDRSELSASVEVDVIVTIRINYPPVSVGDSVTLEASESLVAPLTGAAIVDSGLPKDFDGGGYGLQVASVSLGAEAPPGESLLTLSDTGFLGGLGGWPVTLTADINAISVMTNEAFAAALRPGQSAEDFAWGPVDVPATVVVDATVVVTLPTVPSGFPLWDGAIPDTEYEIPMAGTFRGTEEGTEFTISVDIDDFVYAGSNSVPYYAWEVSLELTEMGADVVATNPTPMPEPASWLLGLAALAPLGALRGSRR